MPVSFPGRRTTVRGARPARARLSLVALEDRIVPATLFVDDDRAQFPAAPYTSIRAAVNDARPGDTVRVFPGSYAEVVTVAKRLTLIGSGPAAVASTPSALTAGPRTGDPNTEAVVQAVNADPFGVVNLRANDVVFRGFTVQGNTTGPGVFTDPRFSGYLIENNLIRNNNPAGEPVPNEPGGGLHLNSNGHRPTVVRGNAFLDHRAESFGDGVYTELTVRNARIEGNYFRGNVHYSVDFAGSAEPFAVPGLPHVYPRSADVVVTGNTIEESGGVLVQYADRIAVTNNTIRHATRTGVYVGGEVNGVLVSGNTLTDAVDVPGFGKHTGIFVGTLDVPGPIRDVVVRDNTIEGHLNGIWLAGGDGGAVRGVVVDHNTVRGNDEYGILLTDADANLVSRNAVDANGLGGIRLDEESQGNAIALNTAADNGGFDVSDESTGPGTGGTANVWFGNAFGTQNRPGLR
jgi:parallel beta-helix repeat protein